MTLADEIADSLATLTHTLAGLLGADLAPILAARAEQAAERIAADLTNPDVAVRTAAELVAALWTGDPPPDWWTTDLGRAVAGAGGDDPVSFGTAAAILGVSRGTVSQLVARETVTRYPGGGLSRASVLRYAQERKR